VNTRTSPSGPGRPVGATPVGARDDNRGRKKKGLLWGALALLALLAISLLLTQCGDDDRAAGTDASGATSSTSAGADPSDAPPESSSSSADSSASGDGGAAGAAGSITVGDRSVLDLAAGADAASALAGLEGQDATAAAVQVLAVPADEGFWVGSSESERVWVQLTGEAGESPYQVEEGDSVDFTGVVVGHGEGFASEVGVDEAAGAGQLTEQGSHIEVAKGDVQLSE